MSGVSFGEFSSTCKAKVNLSVERRPGNALNVEIGTPMPRCSLQSPDGRGLAWVRSGGDWLAYGTCSPSRCPKIKEGLPDLGGADHG